MRLPLGSSRACRRAPYARVHSMIAPSHNALRNSRTGTISTPLSSRRRRGSWHTTSFRRSARFQRLAQVLGMGAQLVEGIRFEQVVERRVGQRVSDERALAGLAGAEQENGAVLDEGAEIQRSAVHSSSAIADLHGIQQLCR